MSYGTGYHQVTASCSSSLTGPQGLLIEDLDFLLLLFVIRAGYHLG